MSSSADVIDNVADRAAAQSKAGWGPLPLPTGKKAMPPKGFTGATSPVPSYADWYSIYEEAPDHWGNLGARIPENVVGVDVDAYSEKNGAATWQLIGGPDLPETVVLSSRFGPGYDGTSGIRFYRLPEGVTQDMLWGAHDGVEILRLDHRYAVSPGSRHPSGGYYRLVDTRSKTFLDVLPAVDDLPMLTLEQALKLSKDGAPWAGEQVEGERKKDDNPMCAYTTRLLNRAVGDLQHKDSRYGTMSAAVWALVNGEDEGHHLGEALTILRLAYIAAVGKERREAGHEPPDSEFDRNQKDAYRKVSANPTDEMLKACCAAVDLPGNVATPTEGDEADDEVEADDDDDAEVKSKTPYDREVERKYVEMRIRRDAEAMLAEHEAGQAAPLESIGLTQFLAKDLGPERYRVLDLWPWEGRVLLAAAAKSGKSTLALNLMASLVDGTPFLAPEYEVTPVTGTVVYLNMELGERTLQRWLADAPIVNRDKIIVFNLRGTASALTLSSPKGRKRIAKELKALGAEVVILDPLAPVLASLGLDENSNSDVAKFFSWWSETLSMAGVVDDIVIHHTGHEGERSRGAARLLDEPDAIWTLTRDKDGDDERSDMDQAMAAPTRYLQAYGRDVELPATELAFDPETRALTLTGVSKARAKAQNRKHAKTKGMTEQVRDMMSDGVQRTKTSIVDLLDGGNRTTKYAVVTQLTEAGFLRDSGLRHKGSVMLEWTDTP